MKSTKKTKLTLFILIVISGFYSFKHYAKIVKDKHCLTTQISSKIFDLNSFKVINNSKFDIMEFKVVNQNSGKTIFENGKSKKGIKNEYGHCMFNLFHNGIKVFEFGHFKYNSWYTINYILTIELKEDKLNPTLKMLGKNASDGTLFYIRFEYDNNGKLKKTSYISKEKEVYNVEEP